MIRILLVDDHVNALSWLQRSLESEFPDVHIVVAADPASLAAAVAVAEFELVVSEYQLSWSDGITVVRAIKAQLPHCPVIMVTASGNEEIAVAALKAGVDDYFAKATLNPTKLATAVRSALNISIEPLRPLLLEQSWVHADPKQAAIALIETHQTLQALIQASPLGITVLDPTGKVLLWNPAAEEIFGWQATEVLGQLLPSIPAHKQAEFQQNIAKTLTGEMLAGIETQRRRKDGSLIYIELWTAVLRDANGCANRLVSIMADVSDRQRAEAERNRLLALEQAARAAAQSAEQRFRDLVNGLDAIVWEADAQTWQFTFVSQRAEALLGYPVERWLTEPNFWTTLIHPDDRDRLLQVRQGVVEQGQSHDFEYRAIAADGHIFWLRDIIYVVTDDQGQAQQLRGLMVDVTERKQATQTLQFLAEASTRLASSLDYEATLASVAQLAIPTLADLCLIDMVEDDSLMRRLVTAHANPTQAAFMKTSLHQYPPSPDKPHPALLALQTGRSQLLPRVTAEFLETIIHDAEHGQILDSLQIHSALCVPLVARGRILGVISLVYAESKRVYGPADQALAEDLAHRAAIAVENAQLYRAAQEANRMKDEFLAIVSHELRSPLNAILGWSRLLRTRTFDTPTTERALETIERNAKLQTQLIEDLLDVSRVIRGKLSLKLRELDLVNVVEAAVDAARPMADAKSIQLQLVIPVASSLIVGDSDRLQQVVWNLLSNAIKFTSIGGQVTLELQPIDQWVEIHVIDTGQGISAAFLPHVFDHFRQADSSTTRSQGGLGLGLAIVRHLVELHGGRVMAASPGVDQGATFTVQLPRVGHSQLQLAAPMTAILSTWPSSDLRPRLVGASVLLIDDEPDTRDYLLTALEQAGATVKAVGSVRAAIAVLTQWRPNVIVSDIGMPEADGYELMQYLQASTSATEAIIPAIALTAYAHDEDRQYALAAGFRRHLTKPIEPGELIAAVAELMQTTVLKAEKLEELN